MLSVALAGRLRRDPKLGAKGRRFRDRSIAPDHLLSPRVPGVIFLLPGFTSYLPCFCPTFQARLAMHSTALVLPSPLPASAHLPPASCRGEAAWLDTLPESASHGQTPRH
ncbi:hypothetical protein LX36DRAFT_379281 [Colletotrichum falcatum]|nr:hypothetical protein LX36DRAFT_379281 [Colletotrichum falcatum]